MLKDKKLKNEIKKAMRAKESFHDFCEKYDIKVDTSSSTKKIEKPRVMFFKISAPIATAIVVFLAVFLPLQLSGNLFGSTSNETALKPYGELSVDKSRIDIEMLTNEKNILIFNTENVGDISEINRIAPKEDNSILLGYEIKNVLYGFYVENEFYAFDFDYLIRSYKNYNFYQEDLFDNLEKESIVNNIKFLYRVQNEIEEEIVYINFNKNDVEYFIYLKSFNEMQELSEENVVIFLQNLFSEGDTNEKIDYKSE